MYMYWLAKVPVIKAVHILHLKYKGDGYKLEWDALVTANWHKYQHYNALV
jgi:hypothetical protein